MIFDQFVKNLLKEDEASKSEKLTALKSIKTLAAKPFEWVVAVPDGFAHTSRIEYANQPIRVRGADVLISREYDSDDESEWFFWRLVDPVTKKRVFHDIKEREIIELLRTNFN